MATSPIQTESLFPSSPNELLSEFQGDTDKFYEVIPDGKAKKFICTIADCQKVFRFHSEIQRHIASHSSYRPHRCTFEGCTKEFKRPSALENHIRSQHTGEAPLLCSHPGCGLRFSTEAKFRYHLVSHMDEKPHRCQYPGCGKSFMTLSQLKQHEKSPTVHKKLDVMYKIEENAEDKSTSAKSGTSDDFVKLNETGVSVMIEPSKKVKYDIQNKRLSQLLTSLQTNPDEGKEMKSEGKNAPILDQILVQNELLRKKLESSEQMLALLRQQIDDMNTKTGGNPPFPLPNLLPAPPIDMTNVNVNNINWTYDVDMFLMHDPIIDDTKSYSKDEDFTMKGMDDGFNNEKMDVLFSNFFADDFGSPFRESMEK